MTLTLDMTLKIGHVSSPSTHQHVKYSQPLATTPVKFYTDPIFFFGNTTMEMHVFNSTFSTISNISGWRFGVAVTRWSRSTQLLYIEPG